MTRAASGRFYNPANPSNIVALETRYDIVRTVLKHEPGTWSAFIGAVTPLQSKLTGWGGDVEFLFFEPGFFGLEFLASLLDLRDSNVSSDKLAREMNELAEQHGESFRMSVYPDEELKALNSKIDKLATVMQDGWFFDEEGSLLVADVYRSTCLKRLGVSVFTLLLRFVAFCLQEGYDPKNHDLIYHMISAASKTPPFTIDWGVSPYKLVLLSPGKYAQRLEKLEGIKNLTRSQMPAWFFDLASEEYVSYRFRLEEDAAAEGVHVAQVQTKTWQDYKKRRKGEAKKQGVGFYTGNRKKDHNYWVYLYMVKGMGSDEIAGLVYPDENVNSVNSIEKAISRRLELARIPYFPFGEKRTLLDELEGLKTIA